MASLHELLADEGFKSQKLVKNPKKVKFRERIAPDDSITLPIYICHDRKSFDSSKPKANKAYSKNGSSVFSSKRGGSDSGKSNTEGGRTRSDEPAIDEVAVKAVISILGGYVGQYLRDENFRRVVREKCYSCFMRNNANLDNGIFTNLELGIESIEKLAENPGVKNELKTKTLRNSIGLLSIVADLNAKSSKNSSTSGTPNSILSACAQLYLSIVYKLEKNDRISARHLLQVFCDSPFIARTHLLPELWDHLFLPHLLHVNIWYDKEVDFLSNLENGERERKMKALDEVYNYQMDMGTIKFAVYYKDWLKLGVQAPTLPTIPLPSMPSYGHSRRKSSDSLTSHSSINKSLYRAVFGPTHERQSVDFDERNGALINTWGVEEKEKHCYEDNATRSSFAESRTTTHRRSSSQRYRYSKDKFRPEPQKPDYFQFLTCRAEPTTECLVQLHSNNHMSNNGSVKKIVNSQLNPSSDLSRAITTISSSDSLRDCEMAIHVITKAWLDSHNGDPKIETTLSKPPVIEGMIEVLFASNDDEVLELAISILAEFVSRNEISGKIILNSDPQLEIFMRLLRSSSLFLKAAVLLYMVRPKAKQMISMEWVPLVLRVLEFGDQMQTLFTVRCSPQVAAYYFLEQLLSGFDEDKNWENGRQVVSLGGLGLLVRRMESGDICEKGKAAYVICCCIKADGRCRHYLSNNLKTDSILSLLVLGKERDCHRHAFALLTELLCLHRITQRTKFLNELMRGWDSLSTMHILLVYLQRAPQEERPMIAVMLLQLDLMGDPLKSSVYREEVVEAITAALDCQTCNEKVQQQSARALLILGGHFSYTGEPTAEKWLLKEAGFHDSSMDSFHGWDIVVDDFVHLNDEDEATEIWQRKAAIVLLTSGKNKLLTALSDSIANGIPRLARASLVTVSWMSSCLHSVGGENLQSIACSILMPQLIECLNYDKAVEERVLASFSLLNILKTPGRVFKISPIDKDLLGHLRNLSRVTWTANELISIIKSKWRHRNRDLNNLPS